jgi:hypothetical protein
MTMQPRHRLGVLVLALSVAAAVTAPESHSALFFLFRPTTAKPGDWVAIRTGGTPANFEPAGRIAPFQPPVRVYLVRDAVAASVHSRFDPRLHFIGSLVADARGRGILAFRVPPLDPDPYAVAAWCPGCAPYSRGETFFTLPVDDRRDIVARFRTQMVLHVKGTPARKTCPVTLPERHRMYGNGALATNLLPGGTLEVTPRHVARDGSIGWKFGWTPNRIRGRLSVHGKRLDAKAPPLRVLDVSWGHSSIGRGGWASAVSFPTQGCWNITGRVKDVSLSFVVRVVVATARSAPAKRRCPVTLLNRPAGSFSRAAGFNFGTARLRTAIYWPRGTLVAGIRPGGGAMAIVNPDGSIWVKLGWWRGVRGKLVIRGRRLDAPAPPLRARVPAGYGARGFQASGLTFPTIGCWQVTGRVARAKLTFVVNVTKR